jgi:hypothetical protein
MGRESTLAPVDDPADASWVRDRIEIGDLVVRYATAIDQRQFEMLDRVFTPDADCDYTEVGGFRGDRDAFKAWMADVAPLFSTWLHQVTNHAVELPAGGDADRATGVSCLFNPVVLDGRPGPLFEGGRYHDQYLRTDDGWRITSRREEPLYHTWPPELRP